MLREHKRHATSAYILKGHVSCFRNVATGADSMAIAADTSFFSSIVKETHFYLLRYGQSAPFQVLR